MSELNRHNLTDEEGVVARVVFGPCPALEPAQGALEQRRARSACPYPDLAPVRKRRDASGEVLSERLLVAREQAEAKATRATKKLAHRGLAAHSKPDQRRLEREADSELTVKPTRSPSTSTERTATPAGQTRISPRSATP